MLAKVNTYTQANFRSVCVFSKFRDHKIQVQASANLLQRESDAVSLCDLPFVAKCLQPVNVLVRAFNGYPHAYSNTNDVNLFFDDRETGIRSVRCLSLKLS